MQINTLSMVKVAGSGHLGTSFSAGPIVWLKHFFSKNKNKERNKNRNIFFYLKVMMHLLFMQFYIHWVI